MEAVLPVNAMLQVMGAWKQEERGGGGGQRMSAVKVETMTSLETTNKHRKLGAEGEGNQTMQ